MSSDFTTARQAVAAAILADADVLAVVETYWPGSSLTVYREVDSSDRPGADNCPMVQLDPLTRLREAEQPHVVVYGFSIGVFVDKPGGYALGADGVVTCAGHDALDELADAVERSATRALLDAGYPADQSPYLPDDADWDRFRMAFYFYKLRAASFVA